jgi:hypothetical protein
MLQLISNNSRGGGGSYANQGETNTVRKVRARAKAKTHQVVHGLSVVPKVSTRTQRGRTKGFYILGRVYTGNLLGAIKEASRLHPHIMQFWVWTPQPVKEDRQVIGIFRRID